MQQTRDEHLWNQRFSAIEKQLAEQTRILTILTEGILLKFFGEAPDDELPDSNGDRTEL